MDTPRCTSPVPRAISRSRGGRLEIIKRLLQHGATAIQEDDEDEGVPMFPEESNALLRKWRGLTPAAARRNAVLHLGWDYIDVPTER